MMNNASFSIIYDGEPVESGTIDVRDLSPSLLALADLVDEAVKTYDKNFPKVSLRIRPDFKPGSFGINFDLYDLIEKFKAVLNSDAAAALERFLSITGITVAGGIIGLFQLIKYLKGKNPTQAEVKFENLNNSNVVVITVAGEQQVKVDHRTWQMFRSPKVRKALEKLLSPLTEKGFNLFKIKHDGKESLSVSDKEAHYFKAPTDHEDENSVDTQLRMEIVSISFNESNKWRLTDGSQIISVSIEDRGFLDSIQKGEEGFHKGDTLEVVLRKTQWKENGKLKADNAIIKVLKHERKDEPYGAGGGLDTQLPY